MARSLRQPPHKLPVFIFHQCDPGTFFTVSSTFSQSTKPKVSIMPGRNHYNAFRYQYVRGFICCSSSVYDLVTIYNPTTRQCLPLPKIESMVLSPKRHKHCYFGYDHVMNEYKVLAMVNDSQELTQTFHVFTLGRDCPQWRKIRGNIDYELISVSRAGVCIDGTIYYVAVRRKDNENYGELLMMSFDVKSERFYHVRTPETLWSPKCTERGLFNHQGKLGCISSNENNISMWIMENAEKQEWSTLLLACLNTLEVISELSQVSLLLYLRNYFLLPKGLGGVFYGVRPREFSWKRKTEVMRKGNEEKNYREEEYLQLPLDLIVEILKKLPLKSLVRFRCVSKQFSTIICSLRDFIESVVTRHLAQPGQQLPLLAVFHHCVPETFFTVSSSFSQSLKPAIYNPTTKRSVGLPEIGPPVTGFRKCNCLFGYDPVMDQYKVLSMVFDFRELTQTFHVFTLGQSQSWRRIQGINDGKLFPSAEGICIDGTFEFLRFKRDQDCLFCDNETQHIII
ncbi:F-box domain [Arabidopsis suecica]|uniref:F-box domain n=1 Tax=Arabidopsis suecica TaxID=45249 RepID=A0A8T2HD11_ARASU|nr:F-box domain [Arabidopsis suecica]